MARSTRHAKGRLTAAWISTLYALLTGLWIYASDTLVNLIAENSQQLATFQFYKGFIFIGFTAPLLYIFVNRRLPTTSVKQPSADAATTPPHTQTTPSFPPLWQSARTPILIFMFLAGAIGGAGYLGYLQQKTTLRQERQDELLTIANAKTEQIASWLSERRSDANASVGDPFFTREASQWLLAGAPTDSRAGLLMHRLNSLKEAYDYAAVALLDGHGRERLSSSAGKRVDKDVQALARQALKTGQIAISDLHQHADTVPATAVIDMVAPLNPNPNLDKQSPGAIYFKIDPHRYLFPLIQTWPTQSASAEILIVRREGNTIRFLNELRYRDDPPLTFRLPLNHMPSFPVLATSSHVGIVETRDYRQVPVLAVVRSVPNSTWFLVAKVDAEEVYAPLDTVAGLMALLVGLFITAAGLGLGLWWQQQRARFLADHYRNELDRQVLVQHFDYLAKYGNDIVLLMDESGQLLEANDSAVSAYGYSRQELVQLNITNLRAPETLAIVDRQIQRVQREGGLLFETVHRRKDGSLFPVEVSWRSIRIQEKNFLHSIIRDITERKQAEAALRESEIRYRVLFEQAPDPILLVDLKTAALAGFNDKAHENLGYTRGEFARLTIADIEYRKTPDEITRHLEKIIKTGAENFETKHRTKSGETRDVLVNSRAIEIGGETFIQSLCRDITDRKRMEAQMRRQDIQLIQADKMAALGILVSGVAHEINNPNHTIQMNAQSLLETWGDLVDLLDSYLDDEETTLWVGNLPYRELRQTFPMLLQDIADGASRIRKIVTDLKDFARPSDNMLPTAFNLNRVVRRALDLLSHLIKKKTERIKVCLETDLPPLVGNPQQMEQVIVNLVLNALDALPDRKCPICLNTRLNRSANCVELRVEDEGVGIPPEHLQRIYEPFFTTKQDRGGTGLGLFITYKLVTANGGTLSFTSELGKGTVARVKLPLTSDTLPSDQDMPPLAVDL